MLPVTKRNYPLEYRVFFVFDDFFMIYLQPIKFVFTFTLNIKFFRQEYFIGIRVNLILLLQLEKRTTIVS